MKDIGLRDFRVELLRETAGQVGHLLGRYAQVLSGKDDGRLAWRQLKVLNQLGVTRDTRRVTVTPGPEPKRRPGCLLANQRAATSHAPSPLPSPGGRGG
jgi:hypothetical protein